MNRRTLALVPIAGVAVLGLSACTNPGPSAAQNDQRVSNSLMETYQRDQPVPTGNYSEMRQTVIEVEQAEIKGTATTTFFLSNDGKVIKSCPSIGYPVPATTQLTNPEQSQAHGQYGDGTITLPQPDPTGVYSGDTSGTYVVCVQGDGTKRVDYWEGYVETEGGQASADANGKIVDSGASTVVQGGTHK